MAPGDGLSRRRLHLLHLPFLHELDLRLAVLLRDAVADERAENALAEIVQRAATSATSAQPHLTERAVEANVEHN